MSSLLVHVHLHLHVHRRARSASCEIPSGKTILVVPQPHPVHVRGPRHRAVTATMMSSSSPPCSSAPAPLPDPKHEISSQRVFTSRMKTKTRHTLSYSGRDLSQIRIPVDILFLRSSKKNWMKVFHHRYRARMYSEVERHLMRLFSEHGWNACCIVECVKSGGE